MAEERQIELTSDFELSAAEVVLDPQRLKQVLFNYISNALKFTPPGGKVMVRAITVTPLSFRLEVSDTGIGIAQADLARLFQDFQQLDDGLSKHAPGTGLGLALTKRLVEAQGGSVGVTSTPGSGSTFFAVIPYTLEQLVLAISGLYPADTSLTSTQY
jgi:signal transduction histidine kinase